MGKVCSVQKLALILQKNKILYQKFKTMKYFSKEFLFRECVLHHHCIMLHLNKSIEWDDELVDEVFMIGFCLSCDEQKQLHMNIINSINTYGILKIIAFANGDNPVKAREVILSTEIIAEIEMLSN